MNRLGILGGSFDPVHYGHLFLAETAREQFCLDQVIWVPSYRPPHKVNDLLEFQHRLAMVKRAIADHPNFSLSDIEAQQGDRSYALTTLTHLEQQHPTAHWFWILGMDAFANLPRWRNSRDLVSRCTWLVAQRRTSTTTIDPEAIAVQFAIEGITLNWHRLTMPLLEISAAALRQRCQTGNSLRYWVPESVRHYILDQKLYTMS